MERHELPLVQDLPGSRDARACNGRPVPQVPCSVVRSHGVGGPRGASAVTTDADIGPSRVRCLNLNDAEEIAGFVLRLLDCAPRDDHLTPHEAGP
jgi:hypothetical protein